MGQRVRRSMAREATVLPSSDMDTVSPIGESGTKAPSGGGRAAAREEEFESH